SASSFVFSSPLAIQQISSPAEWSDSNYPFSSSPLLRETVAWSKLFHTNKRFSVSSSARESFSTLRRLSSIFEVGVECTSPFSRDAPADESLSFSLSSRSSSFPAYSIPSLFFDSSSDAFLSNHWESFLPDLSSWRQRESLPVSCDDVLLTHSLSSASPSVDPSIHILGSAVGDVKQTLTLSNRSSVSQSRLVGSRFEGVFTRIDTDAGSFTPSSWYQLIIPSPESPELRFFDESNRHIASYNVSDYLRFGFSPRILIHRSNNLTIVETFLDVSIPAGGEVLLDPFFTSDTSFSYFQLISGSVVVDRLPRTVNDNSDSYSRLLSSGIHFVNADNGSYSNDVLAVVSFATAGRSSNGAVYYFQDLDTNVPGAYDLNSPFAIASAYWTGSSTTDLLGASLFSGEGAQLADLDGNGYTNDLVMISSTDFFGTDSGSLYLVRDIDTRQGVFDLNILSS
ncbi:MAG: hypothetical protein AABY11_03585, partial [archaeon]